MARLIVGDIHGCYEELLALVGKAELAEGDEVIALGDLFDRGPEPAQVLAFFRGRTNARSILGNHERKHLRVREGQLEPAASQLAARRLLGNEYDAALEFMAGLPLLIELPEAILVHGFWEPGRSIAQQTPQVLVGTLGAQASLEARYDRHWYELYDGPKPLVVGHLDYLRSGQPLRYRDRVFGIDTGCCHGGPLTGLRLPGFEVVSVPSRGDHWSSVRQRFAHDERRPPGGVPALAGEEAVQELLHRIEAACRGVLARLEAADEFRAAAPKEQARLFGFAVGDGLFAALLHRARRQELNTGLLRRMIRTPGEFASVRQRLDGIEPAHAYEPPGPPPSRG